MAEPLLQLSGISRSFGGLTFSYRAPTLKTTLLAGVQSS